MNKESRTHLLAVRPGAWGPFSRAQVICCRRGDSVSSVNVKADTFQCPRIAVPIPSRTRVRPLLAELKQYTNGAV